MNRMLVIHRSRAALIQSYHKLMGQFDSEGDINELIIVLNTKNMTVYLKSPEEVREGAIRGMSFNKILLPNNFINDPAFRPVLIPAAYGGEISFYPEDAPI